MACTPSAVAMCVLPVPGPAHEHHVLRVVHELAPMQMANQGFIDLAVGEVEAGEVPVGCEAGQLQLIGHRAHLPFGRLGLEQLREHRLRGLEGRRSLLGQLSRPRRPRRLRRALSLIASRRQRWRRLSCARETSWSRRLRYRRAPWKSQHGKIARRLTTAVPPLCHRSRPSRVLRAQRSRISGTCRVWPSPNPNSFSRR